MTQETISFGMESEKREALDAVASALRRDRSYIINKAIEAYLDVHQWQIDHIREGLRQADAGEFATKAEMKGAFSRADPSEEPVDTSNARAGLLVLANSWSRVHHGSYRTASGGNLSIFWR
jgi:predicted transcriptional regulator